MYFVAAVLLAIRCVMTQRAQTGLLALTLHVERLFPYELMNLLIPCSSPLVSFSVVFSMPLCSNSSLASRFRAGAWRCSEQRFRLRFRLCRSRNRAGGLLRGARSRGSFRTSPVCMIFRISNRGLCTVLSCSLVGGESSQHAMPWSWRVSQCCHEGFADSGI